MPENMPIDVSSLEVADILQAVLENATDHIVVIDTSHKVICFNAIAQNVLASIHNKELKTGDDYREFVADENKEIYLTAFQKALYGETTFIEKEIAIGEERVWYQLKLTPVYHYQGKLLSVAFTATNIDQRKKKEIALAQSLEKINKFNRELTLLNKINDIILQADDEYELYDVVCDCIVTSGGYKLAWLCHYPDETNNPELSIKPLAQSGQTDYLKSIRISLKDPLQSKGPTANVLLTGNKVITNNVHRSLNFVPWLEQANIFGISSSLVLPINTGSEKPGTINIYSDSIDAFDDAEVAILERLANNLSLAIKNIRNRNDILRTRHQLNERIKELSTIYHLHNILQDETQSVSSVFNRIIHILPPGWQYPDICAAKIEFDGQTYVTSNYKPSPFRQKCDINTLDGRTGFIEIMVTLVVLGQNIDSAYLCVNR